MKDKMIKINTLSIEERKQINLRNIDVSVRLINAIVNSARDDGIKAFEVGQTTTLGDLLEYFNSKTDLDFFRLPNVGRKTLKELHQLMEHSFPEEFLLRSYKNNFFSRKEVLFTFKDKVFNGSVNER